MSAPTIVTIDADVTPRFSACYLRVSPTSCAFVEAHTVFATPRLLAALAEAGRKPEDVEAVVVTHAHLDHAAGASALMAACPNATLYAHPRAARHLIDPTKLVQSATAVYGAERFARLYGRIDPIDASRVRALADGEMFQVGGDLLRVHHTEGHANHHFVVEDPATDTVFTGDTFGLVYPDLQGHGRFAMASTTPTNFDADRARASLAKVMSLGRGRVAPTHFGIYDDAAVIAEQVARFVDRADGWVREAAESFDPPAEIEARLRRAWTDAVLEEAPHFGADELRLLSLDLELNAQGLAVAAAASRSKALSPAKA